MGANSHHRRPELSEGMVKHGRRDAKLAANLTCLGMIAYAVAYGLAGAFIELVTEYRAETE